MSAWHLQPHGGASVSGWWRSWGEGGSLHSWWWSWAEGDSRPHLSWCPMSWLTSENECHLQSLLPDPCPLAVSSEEHLILTQQPHTEGSVVLKTCPGLRVREHSLGGTDPASLDSQTSGRSRQPSVPVRSTFTFWPHPTCADLPRLEPGTPPHGLSVLCTLRSLPAPHSVDFTAPGLKSTSPDSLDGHRHHGTLLTKKVK